MKHQNISYHSLLIQI